VLGSANAPEIAVNTARCIRTTPHWPLSRSNTFARGRGGTDDLGNLALACIDCNLHKGPNLSGIDPKTGKVVELFNPRVQQWEDHFEWEEIHIYGKTDTGRATVTVLAMNSEDQLALRLP